MRTLPFPRGAVKVKCHLSLEPPVTLFLEYFSIQVKQNYRAKLEKYSKDRPCLFPCRILSVRLKNHGAALDMESLPYEHVWRTHKISTRSLSQEAFSRQIGISKGSLGFYERNENLPNVDVILKICSKAGVGLEWLLTGEGPMRPEAACPPDEAPEREQVEPSCPEGAEAMAAKCPYCIRLENRLEVRLDRLEEERRELSSENRRLWKENAELRERCAHYEEREKRGDVLPLFDKPQGVLSSNRRGEG